MDAPLQPPAYAFRPWPPAAAQVVDSYGMVLSSGGMHDFPVAFSTTAPAKFCSPPDGGLSGEQRLARAEKLYAYRSQFFPDNELEQLEGPGVDSSLVDSASD